MADKLKNIRFLEVIPTVHTGNTTKSADLELTGNLSIPFSKRTIRRNRDEEEEINWAETTVSEAVWAYSADGIAEGGSASFTPCAVCATNATEASEAANTDGLDPEGYAVTVCWAANICEADKNSFISEATSMLISDINSKVSIVFDLQYDKDNHMIQQKKLSLPSWFSKNTPTFTTITLGNATGHIKGEGNGHLMFDD